MRRIFGLLLLGALLCAGSLSIAGDKPVSDGTNERCPVSCPIPCGMCG